MFQATQILYLVACMIHVPIVLDRQLIAQLRGISACGGKSDYAESDMFDCYFLAMVSSFAHVTSVTFSDGPTTFEFNKRYLLHVRLHQSQQMKEFPGSGWLWRTTRLDGNKKVWVWKDE